MGGAKRCMEEEEDQRGVALGIAIKAGVLKECEFHAGSVFEGGEPIESAYKLGNAQYSVDEFGGLFGSRREMTDVIKNVVDDNLADQCPSCANVWEKD